MPTKLCRCCTTTKSLDEFYRSARHRDGYRNTCAQCDEERREAKRQAMGTGGAVCPRCAGLEHRRIPGRVCLCGGIYKPLPPIHAEATIGSSAGEWWLGGSSLEE